MGGFIGNSTVNSSLTTTELIVGSNSTFKMLTANATGLYSNTTLIANSVGPYGKTEGNLNVNSATYATSAGSATNASAATNATYATSAGSATNASAATNATYATSAGSATNATYATYAGSLESTQPAIGYSISGQDVSYGGQGGPQIRSQGGGAAMMSFHRPGAYAINFGLGADNQMRGGGWSFGASQPRMMYESGTWSINVNGSAGSATNATYATSAGSATNASAATNATYATSAGSATNATYATSAGSATNASAATNAGSATNAGYATNAGDYETATVTNAGSCQSTVAYTGAYDAYHTEWQITPITNAVILELQVYAAAAFQGANYRTYGAIFNNGGSAGYSPTTYFDLNGGARCSSTYGSGGSWGVERPYDTNRVKIFVGSTGTNSSLAAIWERAWWSGAWIGGNQAIAGYRIISSSGNVTGNITTYGFG